MVFQGDSCSCWRTALRELGTAERELRAPVRDGGGRGGAGSQLNLCNSRWGPAASIRSEPSVLRPAQGWGQRRGQRHQGPAQAVSPERDPSSRRGSFIPSPSPPARAFLPARSDRLCRQVTLCVPKDACWKHREISGVPARPSDGSSVPNSAWVGAERCQGITSPGPLPLAPLAGDGAGAVAPSPLDSRRGLQGARQGCHSHSVSHGATSVPRAGVPSWGPWGSDGEGALPQSGCPEPAAFRREATPERAGGAGSRFSVNTPQPGKILQKSQTLKGLPTPRRFPDPAGSPKIIVSPQSAGSLHPLDPDPAGSFTHHNPQGCSPHQIPQGTPRSPDPAGSPGVP